MMTPEQWTRVEAVFGEALQLARTGRAAYLHRACAGDERLRSKVEALLAEQDRTGPLDVPALDPWPDPDEAAGDGNAAIGPYRLQRLLGRGGMGRVYLAERTVADVRQHVALKLMRRGLDTDDLIARFRTERQILARLSHANIAHLLDVGATADGLPYLVMEYVDGVPILEFCDRSRLPVPQRLRLFQTVCAAVHHAHRSLVVHRDLKPRNILVTADGVPKLLDFGIAKIVQADDAGTELTRTGVRLFTPEYCAPEQVRGEAVTTACDVYLLGLLLYELLAGRQPYTSATSSRAELEHLVLTVDPLPPSAAAQDGMGAPAGAPDGAARDAAAAARGTTAPQLTRLLAGDLDTIVLKALRKEPEERYPSALSLSEDLGRYLAGQPVYARPATARYRARKFIGRNRVAVIAASTVFLTLSSATATTLHQSSRIREESARVAQESARVSRERDKALEVRSFLLETFGATGPDQPTGDTVTARQLLDRRAATLERAYTNDAELQAEMAYVLAEGYEKLGLLDPAERLARSALATRRAVFGAAHPDVAASLNQVGWIMRQRGAFDEAETLLRDAVAVARRSVPPEGDARLARALNDLGALRDARGAWSEAAELYRESIDMRRQLLGEEHIGVAVTTSNLGVTLYHLGDVAGAAQALEHALDLFRRTVGPDHMRTSITETNLAAIYVVRGEFEGAARLQREILERGRRQFGQRTPMVALSATMLANSLVTLGQEQEAEGLLDEAIAIQLEAPGVRREDLAISYRVRGMLKSRTQRYEAAIADLEAALALQRALSVEGNREVPLILKQIAITREHLGQLERAESDFRQAARSAAGTFGDQDPRALDYQLAVIEFLVRRGRTAGARLALADVESVLAEADSAATDSLLPRLERLRSAIGG